MGYYDRQAVSGQLISHVPNSYAERTSRPIYALVYLLGFMVVFIIGSFAIQSETLLQWSDNPPKVSLVAFVWIQNMMEFIGFSAPAAFLVTPLVVVVILLALQITSRTPWRVRFADLFLMAAECVLLAAPLIVLGLLLNRKSAIGHTAVTGQTAETLDMLWENIVIGIGAGIYEELIFRLILICLLMLVFQDVFGMEKKQAVVLSAVLSAVLFSIHHHIYYLDGRFHQSELFTVGKFVFRAVAGAYFVFLYAARGFGITAGTHAIYDVLAATLRAFLFTIPEES